MTIIHCGKSGEVIGVMCDVCGASTHGSEERLEFGALHAIWGEGSSHNGEAYELHLCEYCFCARLAAMKRARWASVMFEEEGNGILQNEAFGRIHDPMTPGDPTDRS